MNTKIRKEQGGVPIGGTTGQALVKASNADNDIDWGDVSAQFIAQDIPIRSSAQQFTQIQVTSDLTGTVMFCLMWISGTIWIQRFSKDSVTGNYTFTVATTLSLSGSNGLNGAAVLGNFLYVAATNSGTGILRRYAIADLSGVTSMTVSGTNDFAGGVSMWSDGTQLYMNSATNVYRIYTISGTTATSGATITYTSAGATPYGSISDGTHVWITDRADDAIPIRKYLITGGAVISTTNLIVNPSTFPGGVGLGLFMGSSNSLGIGYIYNSKDGATIKGTVLKLLGITLP